MVTKRELAEAQQALNDSVRGLVRHLRHGEGGLSVHGNHDVVCRAYDRWDDLRVQLDGQGPAVPRETSIAAAKANIMHKQSLRRTILQMVVAHWNHFGVGMTTDQIQGRLRGKHQSVSARVSELVNTFELLVDTGVKGETSSGKKAVRWGPTAEAIALVGAATVDIGKELTG